MISVENLKTVLRNPSELHKLPLLVRRDIMRWGVRINRVYYNRRHGFPNNNFMELDWDNLLILDAARPEFLPNGEKTTAAVRKSPASCSGGFMGKHFLAGSYHDTVYVTGNPHVSQLSEDTFYTVVNLLEESWDKNLETVHPEDVVKAAIKASKEYQNKRLIVHFMQPHFPFIDPTGDKIESGIGEILGERQSSHPWKDQQE